MKRRLRHLGGIAGATLLVACASTSTRPPADPPIAPPASSAAPLATELAPGRRAFETATQQRAQEAERQGRLAEAALAWEALTVLSPERRDWRGQLQRLNQLVQSRAAAAFSAAQQDRQRGELDRASRGFLAVLALSPEHTPAADALRQIERERNERQFLGRFSRLTITRSTLAGAESRSATEAGTTPDTRNLAEHATLLAAQGELDGAIALLSGAAASARGGDAGLRQLLADLHFRRAESLPPTQRTQVLAALRESLRLDPLHEAAALRLKSLTAAPR